MQGQNEVMLTFLKMVGGIGLILFIALAAFLILEKYYENKRY